MYEFLEYRACDAMMSEPVTLGPDATLAEAEALFEAHDFNAMPVVDSARQLVGLFTKLDLLKAFRMTQDHMFPPYDEIMRRKVSELMTVEEAVATATPRMPLPRALEKMVELGMKSLPVVNDRTVVGIIAREDVMKALRRAVAGEAAKGPI
jgi:CBS domain-containing protein